MYLLIDLLQPNLA